MMSATNGMLTAALSGCLAPSEANMQQQQQVSLMVCCPHCGARGAATDLIDSIQTPALSEWRRVWFACCGLWAWLEETETWTEEAA